VTLGLTNDDTTIAAFSFLLDILPITSLESHKFTNRLYQMDDISDILNDVDRNDPYSDGAYTSILDLRSGQADLQALTRTWVNERGAAELLP
jgi:hypothetical protein